MSDSKKQRKNQQEIVATPGGPRPVECVHRVPTGQTIRLNDRGIHTVSSMGKSATIAQLASEEIVITPGVKRPKSHVHKVEAGQILRVAGSRLRKLDASENIMADFGAVAPGLGAPSAPASGWIAYGYWNNNTGVPISLLKTTWVVPAPPTTQSGQLIYLFNGIQNSTNILQPVLQWGTSPAGGGNFWAIASWYVGPAGAQAFYSELVQVNPGDVLVGLITMTGQSGNFFNYNCEFQGIAGPSLPVENIEQLAWCCETLEAYGITKASDYRAARMTQFESINIQTGTTSPNVTWTPFPPPPQAQGFGEHCTVASNSSINGEVDVFYQT